MTDEAEAGRGAGQRLDKELLLRMLFEASNRQRRKHPALPAGNSDANDLPGGAPGEECPPKLEK